MRILDNKLKQHLGRYVAQCSLATATLMLIFFFEDMLVHAVLFAAIGSTTFVLFVMPRSPTATPRHVIGGHAVGLAVGSLFVFVLDSALGVSLQAQAPYAFDLLAALSVGVTMFMMAVTNTEHAPAAGTSLRLVLVGWNVQIVVFVLTAAVTLSLVHQLLGKRLKDLI